MSDPVTNVEIEDVLASIRRLVSDEGSDSDAAAARPTQEAKTDKLVLTPSLRVADPAAPVAAPAAPTAAAKPDQPSQNTASTNMAAPASPVADAQSAEDVAPPQPAMQLGEEYAVALETDVSEGTSEQDAPEPAALEVEAQDVSSDPTAAPMSEDTVAEDIPEDIPLEDRIAGLEAAVAETPDQWEPDGGEEDAFGDIEAPYWEDEDAGSDMASGADVTSLHARFEPSYQDAPQDAHAAQPQAEEVVEIDPQPYDVPDDASAEALDDLTDMGMPQGMIDEEMLRELVAEIVRQELQGSLGERITRNVRKLVRREIQRALTSRDLS